jgi:hypothetical protein
MHPGHPRLQVGEAQAQGLSLIARLTWTKQKAPRLRGLIEQPMTGYLLSRLAATNRCAGEGEATED